MISFDNGKTFFDEKDLQWAGDYTLIDGKNRSFGDVNQWFPSPNNRESLPNGHKQIGVCPFEETPNLIVPYWIIKSAMIEADREEFEALYGQNPDLNAKEFLEEFGKTHSIILDES